MKKEGYLINAVDHSLTKYSLNSYVFNLIKKSAWYSNTTKLSNYLLDPEANLPEIKRIVHSRKYEHQRIQDILFKALQIFPFSKRELTLATFMIEYPIDHYFRELLLGKPKLKKIKDISKSQIQKLLYDNPKRKEIIRDHFRELTQTVKNPKLIRFFKNDKNVEIYNAIIEEWLKLGLANPLALFDFLPSPLAIANYKLQRKNNTVERLLYFSISMEPKKIFEKTGYVVLPFRPVYPFKEDILSLLPSFKRAPYNKYNFYFYPNAENWQEGIISFFMVPSQIDSPILPQSIVPIDLLLKQREKIMKPFHLDIMETPSKLLLKVIYKAYSYELLGRALLRMLLFWPDTKPLVNSMLGANYKKWQEVIDALISSSTLTTKKLNGAKTSLKKRTLVELMEQILLANEKIMKLYLISNDPKVFAIHILHGIITELNMCNQDVEVAKRIEEYISKKYIIE